MSYKDFGATGPPNSDFRAVTADIVSICPVLSPCASLLEVAEGRDASDLWPLRALEGSVSCLSILGVDVLAFESEATHPGAEGHGDVARCQKWLRTASKQPV
jgi:hypothetical protein